MKVQVVNKDAQSIAMMLGLDKETNDKLSKFFEDYGEKLFYELKKAHLDFTTKVQEARDAGRTEEEIDADDTLSAPLIAIFEKSRPEHTLQMCFDKVAEFTDNRDIIVSQGTEFALRTMFAFEKVMDDMRKPQNPLEMLAQMMAKEGK